ncbi:SDR family oxidoreductase [Parendozoicomonas haliclonae]|uniref:dTDP-4-dehydrorhamnose reductase n=1 Tax=Parendozoicomonas haliclonae TaxID=1960125 RepID=A0A1X7AGR6_9GAMM|nr:sugar nucleotide-binding protein [Parendozoicomonas haliclonae]SMA40577.1 dTDP-4-dehydrorhamnose reductase [Parendozoicomonas haliclonae]
MEVLVIGGSGQIGRELCHLLEEAGISFMAPDREEFDLENHKNVSRQIKKWHPDIVINTAGYRDAGHATNEPSRCFSINRDAVSNLARACALQNSALIQISSWRVFDGKKKEAYSEKDTPNPESVLGNAFWQGEQQIHQHCPKHIILRLSWIISEKGHNRVTRLLKSFEEEKLAGTCPNHKGCPTTAIDVARVLLGITQQISCGIDVWGTYHYNASETIDEYSLAEIVLAEASQYRDIQIETLPVDEKEDQLVINASLDGTKLKHTFGIKPRPWRSALAQLVRNYYQKDEQEEAV